MKPTTQRALRPSQKEIRSRAILAGAAQLFSVCRYQDLRMADLARLLGLGKGTLYLYFPTKEALFLAVLIREMGAWFEGAEERLAATPPGTDPARVARELVGEMLAHPQLPSLQALVHGVLEQNVPREEALAFAQFLHEGVTRVGSALEAAIPRFSPGQGAEFLLHFYSLVIGCQLMSSRPPGVQEALEEPDLQAFHFTFESIFPGAVLDMMNGMLTRTA